MVSISIHLTDEDAAELRARAAALSLEPEALAAAVLHNELQHNDADFEALARRVIAKNRELYARLA